MSKTEIDKKYSKLGKNTLWMTVGSFSTRLLSFFLVPLYTNCLTTAEYGTADLLTVTVNLMIPFLTITASEGILRLTLDKSIDSKQVFTIAINIFLIGLLVLILVSNPVLNMLSLTEYRLFFVAYYATTAITSIFHQFSKGLEHMRVYVCSGILGSFSSIASNIVFLLFFEMGIKGYLLSMIVGNFVHLMYLLLKEKLWKYYLKPSCINSLILKKFLAYCIPLIPNALSWWISNSSDRYMLSYFGGVAMLGVYSVAYKIPSIISVISSVFTGAWQISAVENFGDEKAISFFENVYHKYSSLYIIGCSGVVLFIKIIARILFANEFYNAWPYAIVLTFGAVFHAMGGFLGIIYGAAMKTKQIFVTTLVGAGANIVFNVILIPQWGAMGAAIATLISYLIVWIMRIISSKKFLPMKLNWKGIISSYIILSVQIVITILECSGWWLISAISFLVITIINKSLLIDIYNLIMDKIKRKM